jgi:hypothetical protein
VENISRATIQTRFFVFSDELDEIPLGIFSIQTTSITLKRHLPWKTPIQELGGLPKVTNLHWVHDGQICRVSLNRCAQSNA